jgi:repressor LexA
MIERKHVTPGTRLSFRCSVRERDLILERALLDPEIEACLCAAAPAGSRLLVELTLDDIDDLLGCTAAEANHCDDPKVRSVLHATCDRLSQLLDQFTDEAPAVRAQAEAAAPKFTARQGQYLAFIYYFTKIHGRAPAEADLQKHFKVSPPAVHQMILTLERRALISRVPGKARSVKIRISRTDVPELE